MKNKDVGFTFLEVVIALAVLSIAVIGASFVPALQVGRSSDVRTYASNLGKEILETYRSLWQDSVSFQAHTAPSLPTGLRFSCTIATPQVTSWKFDSSLALVTASGTDVVQVQRVQVGIQCPNVPLLQFTTEIGNPAP
jgi:prepilin-type N-terminal cleavage/methylation domain-containing protein